MDPHGGEHHGDWVAEGIHTRCADRVALQGREREDGDEERNRGHADGSFGAAREQPGQTGDHERELPGMQRKRARKKAPPMT